VTKKFLNQVDTLSGGRLRSGYRVTKNAVSHFGNYAIKAKVRHALGYKNYRKMGGLRLAFLPNELKKSNWNGGGYSIQKIFMALGVQPMPFNPFQSFDIFLNWQDLTCLEFDAKRYIERSYEYTKAQLPQHAIYLNFECTDISKKRIGELHMSVFGYALDIDPTTYHGSVVSKSDENAVKRSQKTGQLAKVYPKPMKGYENGEAPEFYRSV